MSIRGRANAAGLYNGIPVFFCCGAIIKDRLPDRLIICQVITTEKIILEQFRGGQADSKRVQRIEYLLFIIIRIQVDPNKVSFFQRSWCNLIWMYPMILQKNCKPERHGILKSHL